MYKRQRWLRRSTACVANISAIARYCSNRSSERRARFAEQSNQNINSQGFGSANLARRSLDLFEQYLAIALMFATQAVDLRSQRLQGTCDASGLLAPASQPLYAAVRRVTGSAPSAERPFIWNDQDQLLDVHLGALISDLRRGASSVVLGAVSETTASLESLA